MRQHLVHRILGLATGACLLVLGAGISFAADYQQALAYYKSGKWNEAAAAFQALVEESPAYADGYYMLGLAQMQMRKLPDAEKNLQKAIELSGDRFDFHVALAKSQYDRKQYAQTVSTLSGVQRLASDDKAKGALHSLRGYAYAAQKKWPEAIEDLEIAKRVKPDASTMMQLGKGYFAMGHNDKAVPALREVLRADANNVEAHQLIAEALLNLGGETSNEVQKKKHYADALTEADAVLRLQPNSVDGRYLQGRAALGAGNFPKAIEALTKVVAAKPDYCNAHANLGKAYVAQQDWNKALAAMNSATGCSPRLSVAWESKGFVLQKMKKYPEAIEAYQQAAKIKPSASIQQAIASCQENLDVVKHNAEADAKEREQAEAEARAAADYAEQKRKAEEWKKRQENN